MRNWFYLNKFVLCLSVLSPNISTADTVWCSAFKVGCLSAEEKNKVFEQDQERCRKLASNSYREGLQEAIADPTVWQFAGKESAQDYARMRANLMMSICMKRVLKN